MPTAELPIVGAPRAEDDETRRTPYRLPPSPDLVPDVVIPGIAGDEDERLWVPQGDRVHFRPLVFGVSGGYWVNVLRMRRSGVLTRHRHPGPVHAVVLKGAWHYLEHDWVATEGAYAFEVPGEVHTLVVDDGVEEMMTWFHVTGGLVYVDPDGNPIGYEDVHTKLAAARRHYEAVGLGADFADRFIR